MLERVDHWTTEQWECGYVALRKEKQKFRQEISQINDVDQAVFAISKIDALIIIPIIMDIINEIKIRNEKKIEEIFKEMTNKDIKTIKNDSLRNIFNKILGDTKDNYKNYTHPERLSMKDINEEKMMSYMVRITNDFCNGVVSHFKKDNLPVDALKHHLFPFIVNTFFCYFFLDNYEIIDELQTITSELALGWKLKYYLMHKLELRKELMLNPFCGIRALSKYLAIEEGVKGSWQELSLWLNGLHKRSFHFIAEKDREGDEVILRNGEVPFVDESDKKRYEKDKNFYNYFLIKMYDIALFYKNIAHNILFKLSPAKTTDVLNENTNNISVKIDSAPIFHKRDDKKPILPKEVIASILKESMGMKFTLLEIFLEKYQLNDIQKNIVERYKSVIIANLEAYRNNYTFFKPKHYIDAGVAILKLKNTDDPKMQIVILFDLWKTIVGKNSIALVGKIKSNLDELIDMLYKYDINSLSSDNELLQSSISLK